MNKTTILQATLSELSAPVFLAGFDARRVELTVHVCARNDIAELRAQVQRAADKAEGSIRVSVRAHRLRKLAHPRSLEHWLRRFEVDQIIYDPTMVVSRARGLLLAAKSCRLALGHAIEGLFFDPDRRTLLVLGGKANAAAKSTLTLQVRAIIEEAWDRAMAQSGRDANDRSCTNVRVVAELPHRKIIPIDAKSASLARTATRAARRWFAPVALALAMAGVAVPATAKVDPVHVGRQAISTQSTTTMSLADSKFGILRGLSVFTDGVRQELDAFAAAGLQQYFDDGANAGNVVRVADGDDHRKRRRRRREELGQVGGGS
jgi:hypothetical protein